MSDRGLISFGSDNHSGTHPAMLKALAECNDGFAPSYGTDFYSEKAQELFKEHFGKDTSVYFVFNGTAANVMALRLMCTNYQSVFCSDIAHMWVDEGGAPESEGIKLIPLTQEHGRLTLEVLKKNLVRRGDQHYSQTVAVSLTQPTEMGTCYSPEEIKQICQWAKSQNLYVHLDGARLANACVYFGKNFKEMTRDLGVDVVSFGGTKNGLMFGEAVVILNPALTEGAKYIRKQMGQLPSKSRFIAAQFIKYLENDFWKEIAGHSISMAKLLHEEVKSIPKVQVTRPRESNAVFATVPQPWVKAIREKFFFYVWDEDTFECRWMATWNTTPEHIKSFANLLKEMP
ncbi:MAG: low specificity L-threonine aldolase [Bdellovibrionota bacterium]